MKEKKVDSQLGIARFRTEIWVALAAGLVFLVLTFLFYRFSMRTIVQITRQEEGSLTQELGLGVRQLVDSRTRALQTFLGLYPNIALGDRQRLESVSDTVVKNTRGIYALAWVDPTGVIRHIFPATQNQRALGKNLLENPLVAEYLIASRETRTPQLTQVIKTYQGINTFVIYLPMISQERFVGWLSVVLDHRTWFDEFLTSRDYKDLYFRVCWERFADNCYDFGSRPEGWEDPSPYRLQVLNQPLVVEAAIRDSRGAARMRWLQWAFLGLILAVAALLSWVIFVAERTQRKWLDAISILKLRNASVHAMLAELAPCVVELETWGKTNCSETGKEIESFGQMVESQRQVLSDVEQIQNISQGREGMLLTEVSLFDSIQAVLAKTLDLQGSRRVRIETDSGLKTLPKIIVDRELLEGSILFPVIAGALERAEEGDVIQITSKATRNNVFAEISLQRRWAQLEIVCHEANPDTGLADFRREDWTRETLGLLQAVILMEHFDGEISHTMDKHHTSICMEFLRSRNVEDDQS